MRKLVLFAALVAILAAYGCDDNTTIAPPDLSTNGRVVGTIAGVVTDGATNGLLAGVSVAAISHTTEATTEASTTTNSTGHYEFADLVPGDYVLTFVMPDSLKAMGYASGVRTYHVPNLDDLDNGWGGIGITDMPTDRDFHVTIDADFDLFPLTGSATGYVYAQVDNNNTAPASGANVVADFSQEFNGQSYFLVDNEFYGTTDADGMYTISGLPAGINGTLRVQTYSDGTQTYGTNSGDLDLTNGGLFHVEPIFLATSCDDVFVMSNDFFARGVAPGASLSMTFNRAVDTASFRWDLLVDNASYPAQGTWSGNTLTISPDGEMPAGADCELLVWGDCWNSYRYEGSGVDFWVTGGRDVIVIANNFFDRGIDAGTPLTMTFNQPMDPATFQYDLDVTIPTKSIWPVSTSWNSPTNTELTITPLGGENLPFGSACALTISGQHFASTTYSFWINGGDNPVIVWKNFDTTDPFPLDGSPVIKFSHMMDSATFTYVFKDNTGTAVPFDAQWTDDYMTLTLDPVAPELQEGMTYTIALVGEADQANNFTDGNDFNSGNLFFTCVQYQAVTIVDNNLVDNFHLASPDLWVKFSADMDHDSFLPDGAGYQPIVLRKDGSSGEILGFTTQWDEVDNARTLHVMPVLDFAEGQDYWISFAGFSTQGKPITGTHEFTFMSWSPDTGFVVDHNLGADRDQYPLDQDLWFQFNEAMDMNETLLTLTSPNAPAPHIIYGTTSWNAEGTELTFVPNVTFLANTEYSIAIDGMTANGGPLSAGLDDLNGPDGYNTTFTTIGGITYLGHNLQLQDGAIDDVAVDADITLYFNMEMVLSDPTTFVTLTNTSVSPNTPVAITLSQAENDTTFPFPVWNLIIHPDQDMPIGNCFELTWRINSTFPDDFHMSSELADPFTFCTDVADLEPVGQVAFAFDDVNSPAVDFNSTGGLIFNWTADPMADKYYIYAHQGVSVQKDNFYRVATVLGGSSTSATVSLTSPTGIFDTRPNFTTQSPFDADVVEFYIKAYNDFGEGPASEIVTLADVVTPTGSFTAQDVSADDTDNAGDGADLDVVVTFTASEYLDPSVDPGFTIAEDPNSDIGDPNYTATIKGYEVSDYEDIDGKTLIKVYLTVADGKNGAGDLISITHFTDTTGNEWDSAADPVTAYLLTDGDAPSGTWISQTGSADNSLGTAVGTMTCVFEASELIFGDPTLTVVEDALPSGVTNEAVLIDYDVATTGTFTTITAHLNVPIGGNATADILRLNDLVDMAGNSANPTDFDHFFEDYSSPEVVTSSQTGSSDNRTAPTTVDPGNQVDVDFVFNELMDETIVPGVSITDDPVNGFAGDVAVYNGDYIFTNDGVVTTLTVTVWVPEGMNAMANIVAVTGLTDASGNAITGGATFNLLDTTAPASVPAISFHAVGGDNEIGLSWEASTEHDLFGYNLYRSEDGGATYAFVTTVLPPLHSYNDAGVTNGTAYRYQVTTEDVSGNNSPVTDDFEGDVTPVDNIPPAQPQGVVGVYSTDYPAHVDLSWTANTDTDLAGYQVWRGTDGGLITWLADVLAPTVTYTDNAVTYSPSHTYQYYIVAVDEVPNLSLSSNPVVTGTPVNTDAPAQPGLLVATGVADSPLVINLDWPDNAEGDLTGYVIKRGTSTGGPYATIGTSATSDYVDNTVVDGTPYYYVVEAADDAATPNLSVDSNEATATSSDTTAPDDTANISLAAVDGPGGAGSGDVTLTWTEPSNADTQGYRLWYSTTSPATAGSFVDIPFGNNTKDLLALTSATPYFFNLKTVDTSGNEVGPDLINEITYTTP